MPASRVTWTWTLKELRDELAKSQGVDPEKCEISYRHETADRPFESGGLVWVSLEYDVDREPWRRR